MIRTATLSDIPALVRMGRAFVETGVDIPFDENYASRSIQGMMLAYDREVFVLDLDGKISGMLCAAVADSPLAPVRVGVEIVFWIDPEARGRWANQFIQAYEAWAKNLGAHAASLSSLADVPVGKFYERAGYCHTETTHSKVL